MFERKTLDGHVTETVLADTQPKATALHKALVEQVAEGKPPTP